MGLFSFVQDVGRKIGLFGGREAAEVEAAKAAATEAAAAATAAASVADAAAKEAARRAAVAADIKAAIISYVPVAKLEVAVDGATVTVRGTTYAQADREKAVLIAGNTEGVATVDDQLTVEVPEPPAVFHQVVKGDTLSAIAAKTYGVMRLYDVIFEANRPMLEHPDKIYPGQMLRIPRVGPPVHVVKAGETLGAIAKHWYGDAKRYTDIAKANALANPDAVSVGQSLNIPVSGPAVA